MRTRDVAGVRTLCGLGVLASTAGCADSTVHLPAVSKCRAIPYLISAVSPDGREAISINFARLRSTRNHCAYGGTGQDPRLNGPFCGDDGLFLADLPTGKARLIASIAQVGELVFEVAATGIEYFNYTLLSRDGGKIFCLVSSQYLS